MTSASPSLTGNTVAVERAKTVQLVTKTTGGTEQSLGYTGQCGLQRVESVSGPCASSGARENFMCALKSLANLQRSEDKMVDTIYEGLQELSRLSITKSGEKLHRRVQP